MEKNQTLKNFAANFYQQILQAKENDAYNMEFEDFFTIIMLEYLEEVGEVEDPIICPFRGYGLQMNGYSVSGEYENVDIYVSLFSDSEEPKSISKTDVDACLKRAIQLYRKAINDLYTSFEKDNDTYGFASALNKNRSSIQNVRIVALTNGLVKPISFKNISIEGAEVSFSIWDIDRLHRCVNSGKMRETVEIDFVEKFNTTIECN
ncbi:MAG: hypothetical protein VR72_14865 [Clostridiaceae bacterium BRH_c20a]|nr:MAG: hypothetical protein VR72_14865 [Clostridiaceae bacterium BRH_c20a]